MSNILSRYRAYQDSKIQYDANIRLLAKLIGEPLEDVRADFRSWISASPLSIFDGLDYCIRRATRDEPMPWDS